MAPKNAKIRVRISRTGIGLFSKHKYEVIVNNNLETSLHKLSPVKDIPIEPGKHDIIVSFKDTVKRKRVIVGPQQNKVITINPSMSRELTIGFTAGLAIGVIFFQYMILENISIPLFFIPFIPLILLIARANKQDYFELSTDTLKN